MQHNYSEDSSPLLDLPGCVSVAHGVASRAVLTLPSAPVEHARGLRGDIIVGHALPCELLHIREHLGRSHHLHPARTIQETVPFLWTR